MKPSGFTLILSFMALFIGSSLAFAGQITIGFHAPLTGFAAADGKSAVHGAELAVEQINSKGGVNGNSLKLVIYDDQASPKNSEPIANKLISKDGVKIAISGSYSGATRAAAGVFQKSRIPYISAYAVHPSITRAGDYVFRTSFVGEVQGRAGAKLVGEVLNKKRVVLITLKNDFGRSLVRGFKEKASAFGINIVSEYEYSIKDRQFGPIIAKVKADNPEAIYATGYFFTAGPLVRQLRAAGLKALVIGQEGYDSQKFIEIAGNAAEGVIITPHLTEIQSVQSLVVLSTLLRRKLDISRIWLPPVPILQSTLPRRHFGRQETWIPLRFELELPKLPLMLLLVRFLLMLWEKYKKMCLRKLYVMVTGITMLQFPIRRCLLHQTSR